MHPIRLFRRWASQWPEARRWALVLWAVTGVAVIAFGAWLLLRQRAERHRAVPAAARTVDPRLNAARRARERFPAEPALWAVAGRYLAAAHAPGARELLRAAALADPDDVTLVADLLAACWRDDARAEARGWWDQLPRAARQHVAVAALGRWAGDPAATELAEPEAARLAGAGAVLLERPATTPAAEAAGETLRVAAQQAGIHRDDARRLLALTGAASAESIPPENTAATAAADLLAVQGDERAALTQLDPLAPALANSRRVTLALARRDLSLAQSLLRSGAWGALPADAVDLAFTAHRATAKNRPAVAEDLWLLALHAGSGHAATLARLAQALGDAPGTRLAYAAATAAAPRDAALARHYALWTLAAGENDARRNAAFAAWQALEPERAALARPEGSR
ncbi:MAG: hypothetical protein HYV96_20215 [Opitutae bacterium]|nr:hypothetical protein [Opitutae bacterium]